MTPEFQQKLADANAKLKPLGFAIDYQPHQRSNYLRKAQKRWVLCRVCKSGVHDQLSRFGTIEAAVAKAEALS
jgi:hypothetical protein